jgi:hydrogenase maturation protease
VIVDALSRGEPPGTLFVFEPKLAGPRDLTSPDLAMNPHGMDPGCVLNLAASMGTISAQILILGCEPNDFGDELDGRMGLSPKVRSSVEEAANMIESLVEHMLMTKSLHPMQLQSVAR